MKLEKISDKKFQMFASSEVKMPHTVFGGYKGETNQVGNPGLQDQIKDGGGYDETQNGQAQNGRNDGLGG
jgi:hypothetical protein